MALEAVHSRDDDSSAGSYSQPGPRRRRREQPPSAVAPGPLAPERVIRAFAHARARLVTDERNRLVLLQLVEPGSERVIQEIPDEQLASADYHGILVDVDT